MVGQAKVSYEVKTRVIHDNSGWHQNEDMTDLPCKTITLGVNCINSNHYQVEYYRTDTPPPMTERPTTDKPAYAVSSMAEIAALPWNGFKAVSTFSGCGGSSLGYKMAGFRVLWANEFIPAAQETYRANHHGTILDTRDIRTVSAESLLDAIGMQPGELDLFDGSPPCASFSTAGKREAGWGKVKNYSDTKQRTDDLFFEYVRLIKGVQPKVFVAENVSGLVKGTAKGYFKEILQALKECGYTVEARLLDAQWLGVPQMRQRIIFMGVRSDLGIAPAFPAPLPYRYTVRDALPWIMTVQYGDPTHHKNPGTNFERGLIEDAGEHPVRTVKQSTAGISGSGHLVEAETDISRYAIGAEWEHLEQGQQSGKYFQLVRPALDAPVPTITAAGGSGSIAGITHPTEKRKFSIAELRRICGFPDDFVLTGTYAQQWERLGRAVPPVMMSHIAAAVRDDILAKL
jgi:DNA (cytosine-5)-methyltransferase 1